MSYLQTTESEDLLNYLIEKNNLYVIPGQTVYRSLDDGSKLKLCESLLEENFDFYRNLEEWIEEENGFMERNCEDSNDLHIDQIDSLSLGRTT